ncbi:MAG: calcium-translocating P-type ATPase, PMCA-typ [Candidatus Improbicoccus devescovinae]|nr:MAG: calcium-translocating P-type ATPase, PMCA-typ [Candidatus Improbicoccus devescovinae]
MNWQTLKLGEVLKILDVDFENGLSVNEVKKRQKKYGKNALKSSKKKSFFGKVLEQFSDFMVITLFIAAGISFAMSFVHKNNEYVDSIVILVIVIFNAIIGVTQETKAEKAIESLKKLTESSTKVLRNKREQYVLSQELVPGDILLLESGSLVPADARIIKAKNLKVEESVLTGESSSVDKNENSIFSDSTQISDMANMLFSTSFIVSGRTISVVVETGMNTQVGKIANLIDHGEAPATPLQTRLTKTGKTLSIVTLIICSIIFILGLIQGISFLDIFMISISLAVAAIPEGLPAVVTLALAVGVNRLAKKHAIVRKPPSVETLGCASVICSDKTGTLTQNKMSVVEIRDANSMLNINDILSTQIIFFSALCNNSKQTISSILGESTENSLLEAAIKLGKTKIELEKIMPRIKEIPFDTSRKIMTTIHKYNPDSNINNLNKYFLQDVIITKGAPDILINLCTSYKKNDKIFNLDNFIIKKIKNNCEEMASDGLRTLAIAYKKLDNINKNPEENLIFLGLIGISDPPRIEAKESVKRCLEAGIKPVMITGDHILTAKAIASKLGILQTKTMAITGLELNKINQNILEKKIFSYSVFARVTPAHKVRIIKAFQARGAVVAMTGDGVNDAPALKVADIGCAMGLSGTDVAKSASDIILTDDNFSTIVEAISQGRGIYKNIKKTVHFLLSTNVGEVVLVLLAFLMRLPSPLFAIQLLWINFVTDSFPALALAIDPIEKNIMKHAPINSKENLFSGNIGQKILIEGCFIGILATITFIIGRNLYDLDISEPIVGRTMAFVSLGLSQLTHAFNVQSEESIFKTGIFTNIKLILAIIMCMFLQIIVTIIPWLTDLFGTVQLSLNQWLIVIFMSILPIFISEIEKILFKNTKIKFKNRKLTKLQSNLN